VPRIDLLLFGYRVVKVKAESRVKLLNLLMQNGISVKIFKDEFLISEKQFKAAKELIVSNPEYSVSEERGLFGFLGKYRKRYGIFAAIILSILISVFSSSRIWDIRIDGVTGADEEKILDELASVGFSVGEGWWGIDKSKIEADMLSISENVSWININQRGTVAYVSVAKKILYEDEEENIGYANVIADCDAVIEEITVKTGFAKVKAGETVKKGQILISGVIPAELGGGFCYAEGKVVGRYSGEISVSIQKTKLRKSEKERKLSGVTINFFNFSFKIFEKYRKTHEEYDIIKNKSEFHFLNGRKLPFSVDKEYAVFYEEYERRYSESEMTEIARQRMTELLENELSDKNLLKIKTNGQFYKDSYILVSEYVASSDIGKPLAFEVIKGE